MATLRGKKKIPEMIPIKKWLYKRDAMSYMDLGDDKFMETVISHNLTTAFIRKTAY